MTSTIKTFAEKAGKSNRTIQRWIESYNKKNDTDFATGVNAVIEDENLLSFLNSKFSPEEPVEKSIVSASDDAPAAIEVKDAPIIKKAEKRPQRSKDRQISTLQERLSADWLIVVVLLVILWADMFAFGSIGHHEFGDKIKYSAVVFSIIGLATGIGSVVTYNRIKNVKTAEIWKWCFGVLQFAVFSLAINEQWVIAEMVMTSMFVLVFIGVQRSIKK